MRTLTALFVLMAIILSNSFAQAEQQIRMRKQVSAVTTAPRANIPAAPYAVYVTDITAFVTIPESKTCDEISNEWATAVQIDKFSEKGQDLFWDFEFSCYGRTGDKIYVRGRGLVYALNETGDKFLNESYNNAYRFYESSWYFQKPTLSTLFVEVSHGNKKRLSKETGAADLETVGFLRIPFYEADAYFNSLIEKIGEADAIERRALMFRFLTELMPERSAEELNTYLDAISDSTYILFSFRPIFRTTFGFSTTDFSWAYDYGCPDWICYPR